MCRKLVVTNKLGLGSRELGWETYSLPKGEIVEFTSRQLKDAIRTGSDEVYGLKVDEETGKLVFDTEGFFTTNMMQKAFEDLAEKRADERVLEEKRDAAMRMIAGGKLSAEEIASYSGLPINIVEELANLQPA